MRHAAFLLLLCAGCASAGDPDRAPEQEPAREGRLAAPVDLLWIELAEVYRSLGIPITDVSSDAMLVRSGNLAPYEQRIFGDAVPVYYRCGTSLSVQPARVNEPYISVVTTLAPDGAGTRVRSRVSASLTRVADNGTVQRQECASMGVLEERILRALEQRAR